MLLLSMTQTRRPSFAAMIAAFWPPGPEPMTARSKSYVCSMLASVPDDRERRHASHSAGSSGLSREASQRGDHDLALARLPHLGHRSAQIAAVASGDQPGVEDCHNTAITEPPDQPTGALGE